MPEYYSSEDKELEKILRKKYEAYLRQAQSQATEASAQQQLAELQKREILKQQLMKQLFAPDAREVLRNLELRGDTKLVEQLIAWAKRLHDMGRLQGKITKEQLKVLLKYLRQEEKKEWKITFKRK
jgi:DNA-binding TFAR19-related protein (PDSD5 family)